jgi:hypothetical protein
VPRAGRDCDSNRNNPIAIINPPQEVTMYPLDSAWPWTLRALVPLALLASHGLGDAAGQQLPSGRPQPLPANVVAAWEKAGAIVGWVHEDEFGRNGYEFVVAEKGVAGDLPAFWGGFTVDGVLGKLPPPTVPFALDLSYPGVTDADLKELAGLKNLHTLTLRYSKVTDAGLKELAKLTSLHNLKGNFMSASKTALPQRRLAGLIMQLSV